MEDFSFITENCNESKMFRNNYLSQLTLRDAVDNVFIQSHEGNASDGHRGIPKTAEQNEKNRLGQLPHNEKRSADLKAKWQDLDYRNYTIQAQADGRKRKTL